MVLKFRQVLCLAAASGMLAVVAGCGETTRTQETSSPVPTNVQESNKNMENFMKTQGATKKR